MLNVIRFNPDELFFGAELPISTVAKLFAIHQRTLRIYDKEGLLKADRTKKNRRIYTFDDIERLNLILFLLRNLGLNLAGVKLVINMLEKSTTNKENYFDYINSICNVSKKAQMENIKRFTKRGRTKKVK